MMLLRTILRYGLVLACAAAAASCGGARRYRVLDGAVVDVSTEPGEGMEAVEFEDYEPDRRAAYEALRAVVGVGAVTAVWRSHPDELEAVLASIEAYGPRGFQAFTALVGSDNLAARLADEPRGVADVLGALSTIGADAFEKEIVTRLDRNAVEASFRGGRWSFGYLFSCNVGYLREAGILGVDAFVAIVDLLDTAGWDEDPRGFSALIRQIRILGPSRFAEIHAWMGRDAAAAVPVVNDHGLVTFREFVALFGKDATIRATKTENLDELLAALAGIGPAKLREFMRLVGRGPGLSDIAEDTRVLRRLFERFEKVGLPNLRALVVRLREELGAESVVRGFTHCRTCFFTPMRMITETGPSRFGYLLGRMRQALGRDAVAAGFARGATHMSRAVYEVDRLKPDTFEDLMDVIGRPAAAAGLARSVRGFCGTLTAIRRLPVQRFPVLVDILGRDVVSRAVAESPNEFAAALKEIEERGLTQFGRWVERLGDRAEAFGLPRGAWCGNVLLDVYGAGPEMARRFARFSADVPVILGEFPKAAAVWDRRAVHVELEHYGIDAYRDALRTVGPAAARQVLEDESRAFIETLKGFHAVDRAGRGTGRDAYLLAFFAAAGTDDDQLVRRVPAIVGAAGASEELRERAISFLLEAVEGERFGAAETLVTLVSFLAGAAARSDPTEAYGTAVFSALGEAGKYDNGAGKVLSVMLRDPEGAPPFQAACLAALGVAGQRNQEAVARLAAFAVEPGLAARTRQAKELRAAVFAALRTAAATGGEAIAVLGRFMQEGPHGEQAAGIMLDLVESGNGEALRRVARETWPRSIRDTLAPELETVLARGIVERGASEFSAAIAAVFGDDATNERMRATVLKAVARAQQDAPESAARDLVRRLRSDFERLVRDPSNGSIRYEILALAAAAAAADTTDSFAGLAAIVQERVAARDEEILFDGLRFLKTLAGHGSDRAYRALLALSVSRAGRPLPVLQDLLIDFDSSEATKLEIIDVFALLLERGAARELEELIEHSAQAEGLLGKRARQALDNLRKREKEQEEPPGSAGD
jgi:hypothetical protein